MGEGAVQEPGDVARLKPCLVYINLHPFEEDRRKATVWTWKKGLYQSRHRIRLTCLGLDQRASTVIVTVTVMASQYV